MEEPCEGCGLAPADCKGAEKCELRAIKSLKDGECWIWPESDYGRAEIWFKNGTYFVFGIPTYGGEPSFDSAYSPHRLVDLYNDVSNWT